MLEVLAELRQRVPQWEVDGPDNIWILKPGGKSRGRGIHCFNNLAKLRHQVCQRSSPSLCFAPCSVTASNLSCSTVVALCFDKAFCANRRCLLRCGQNYAWQVSQPACQRYLAASPVDWQFNGFHMLAAVLRLYTNAAQQASSHVRARLDMP